MLAPIAARVSGEEIDSGWLQGIAREPSDRLDHSGRTRAKGPLRTGMMVMSENEIAGAAQSGLGELESAAGDALGSKALQREGEANEVKGGARRAAGKVQARIDKIADKISEGVARAGDTTRGAVERTAIGAQRVAGRVDPFVSERPYSAVGIALGAGVVLGLLLAGRGPKIIYVNPRD